jgi:hypothetical protein
MNIQEEHNLRQWCEVMWNTGMFDHRSWTGWDEVHASIKNYLKEPLTGTVSIKSSDGNFEQETED